MGVSIEDTQKKLDKALQRNLEVQAKVIVAPAKLEEPSTPETETTDIED